MFQNDDTIAAIATPPGRGGIGVIRVSGPLAPRIARQVTARDLVPRYASLAPFRGAGGDTIDTGLALLFRAPHSYTGEDVLELHGHGGSVVLDMLLRRVLELGARPATPGEFSARAFLNEKMDLAQAEAVADLIDSASEAAARSAQRSLAGRFSMEVGELVGGLIALRTHVEGALDFAEEEIDLLAGREVRERLDRLRAALARTVAAAEQGVLLKEGMKVVIAGRPNVGKSSLLNRLAGDDAAIVTDVPGTTRDPLRAQIQIDGLPLHLVDTAGLQETSDRVEREGIRRAWKAIESADTVLLLIDDRGGVGDEDRAIRAALPESPAPLVVRNKIDLSPRGPRVVSGPFGEELRLSAKTGEGIERLRERLKSAIGFRQAPEGVFMARRRHLVALARATSAMAAAREHAGGATAGDLLAEDLRAAQNALSEITGEFSNEDLLDEVFSTFCIGK